MYSVFQLPDYVQGLFAGAHRRHKLVVGEAILMWDGAKKLILEERAIAAHRKYIEAFIAWERLMSLSPDANCRETPSFDDARLERISAEGLKEDRRIALRDLITELGYIPRRLEAALPTDRCLGSRRFR